MTECKILPKDEIKGLTDKELIRYLRTCEKVVNPLQEELQRRRELANTSCPI